MQRSTPVQKMLVQFASLYVVTAGAKNARPLEEKSNAKSIFYQLQNEPRVAE
jgi:hypothetical protein